MAAPDAKSRSDAKGLRTNTLIFAEQGIFVGGTGKFPPEQGIVRPRGRLCETSMRDRMGFTIAGAAAPETVRLACMRGRMWDGMTSTFADLDISLLLSY